MYTFENLEDICRQAIVVLFSPYYLTTKTLRVLGCFIQCKQCPGSKTTFLNEYVMRVFRTKVIFDI